jgi:hypothetical protein
VILEFSAATRRDGFGKVQDRSEKRRESGDLAAFLFTGVEAIRDDAS